MDMVVKILIYSYMHVNDHTLVWPQALEQSALINIKKGGAPFLWASAHLGDTDYNYLRCPTATIFSWQMFYLNSILWASNNKGKACYDMINVLCEA